MNATETDTRYYRRFPYVLVCESTGQRVRTHVWALNADDAVDRIETAFTRDRDLFDGWTYEALFNG